MIGFDVGIESVLFVLAAIVAFAAFNRRRAALVTLIALAFVVVLALGVLPVTALPSPIVLTVAGGGIGAGLRAFLGGK